MEKENVTILAVAIVSVFFSVLHLSYCSVEVFPQDSLKQIKEKNTEPFENTFFAYYCLNFERVYTRCINQGDFAITFDDGPNSNTDGVLDVLAQENVKATFFINGNNEIPSMNDPETQNRLKRIYKEGHEIGSHTWSHANLLSDMSAEKIYKEMIDLEDKVKDIVGIKLTIMRPPFGYVNKTVADIITKELNYSIILWNLETKDWTFRDYSETSMEQYTRVLEKASNRTSSFISLHHDTLTGSAQLARKAIQYIKQKGYHLVTISECIGLNKRP